LIAVTVFPAPPFAPPIVSTLASDTAE